MIGGRTQFKMGVSWYLSILTRLEHDHVQIVSPTSNCAHESRNIPSYDNDSHGVVFRARPLSVSLADNYKKQQVGC